MVASKQPAGARRLYRICLQLALGSSIWGYNIGILSSVLVHPGWRRALHDPAPAQKGLVTGFYYVGTLISYLFLAHPLADFLGRRYAARVGTLVLCLGALLMAAAAGRYALYIMVAGRLVCGLGVGVVSTTVPLYQSEMSPAKERGKYVTINHVGFVAGLAAGLWAGYFVTFWKGDAGEFWGWRTLILIQLIPSLTFAAMLPSIPETPRWLLQNGDMEKASKVLHWLREDVSEPADTAHELQAINRDIETYHSAQGSFVKKSLALFREKPLFARMWRAFLLQFMAQMCGATAMKYYLPTLLKAFGLGTRLALMAGAVEMTAKIGMTVVEMWIIDRFGRKTCLAGGSVVMAVAMLVNGVLPQMFPKNGSPVADAICIAFIFIYAMGYSLGLGPAAWVYSSEIFPTTYRARGLNFAASGGSIGSIIVAQVWPIGVAKFGSRVYFFFFAVNAICVPVIWLFYPETKGCALEDMDSLFQKHSSESAGMGLHGLADPDEQREPDGGLAPGAPPVPLEFVTAFLTTSTMDGPGGNHEPWWAGRARYWKTTLSATSLTFAILATIFYALRVYASRKSRRIVRPDDIFMGLAVVFMWAETAAVLLKCYNGVGTPSVDLPLDKSSRLSLGSWLVAKFCVLSMACCRLSIILFFRTVFGVYDKTRYLLNFLAVFNVVWAIASLCVSIWSCSPVTYYWDKSTAGGWCVAPSVYNHESVAFSVLGLLTDLAILATPQPRIWRSQIDLQHKKAITAILGVGVIVCIFSLLRCVQFAYFDTAHLSTSGNLETTWTFLENDISIICGCMPQLRPLFPRYLRGRAPSYAEDENRVRYDGNNHGIFTWGKRIKGVQTTITSTSVFSNRTQHKSRNSSEVELNAIEVETETTVTRSQDNEAQS